MSSQRGCKARARLFLGLILLTIATLGCRQDASKLAAKGDKYLAAGEAQNAVIEYKRALRVQPKSAETLCKLGKGLLASHLPQQGVAAYLKATEVDPEYVPARLVVGQIRLLNREYPEAQAAAQSILQKDPGNKEARLLLAYAYAGQKNLPEGTKALEKLLEQYSDYIPGYINLGRFYLYQKKPEAAQQLFEKAVSIDPKSIEARQALGGFYLAQKDAVKAEQQIRAAVDNNPDSVDARLGLAAFYRQQGRPNDAEPLLRDIIRLQKNSPESRFDLAKFYVQQGRVDDARKVDNEIAKDHPSYMSARLQLVELALRERKYDDADKILGQILKDNPKQPEALILAAQVSLNRKDAAKAIQQLETAEKYSANNPIVHYWKGLAYLAQGNPDRAQESFERAIGLQPQFLQAQIALTELLLANRKPNDALLRAQEGLKQNPNLPQLHLLAGESYYAQQKFAEAEKSYQKFAELAPDSPQGPLRLGSVYFSQRRFDLANTEFEKALSMNPKQTDALQGVVAIYRIKGQNDKALARVRQQAAVADTADLENLLGKMCLDLNQNDAAEKALKRSLELDSQNYRTYGLLTTLYARQKSLDKAVAEVEAATRINPRQVGGWTVLGILHQDMGNIEKAKQSYLKALEIDSGAAVAANNLAWLYCENGSAQDLDAALDLARRARQALPKMSTVSDTLGWVYFKRQLYDSAVPLLEEAVRDDPKNGEYRFHLAATLLGAGKKQQAQSELKTALQLDAGLRKRSDVQKVLDQLPNT